MTTAQSLYDRLQIERLPFLQTARDVALFTIPSLTPPEGHRSGNRLYVPFQSHGSDCMLSIAGKLQTGFVPSGFPFFKAVAERAVIASLDREKGEDVILEQGLVDYENAILKEIERRGFRQSLAEILLHLAAGGNILIRYDATGIRTYLLSQYVVERDHSGNILNIVIEERVPIDRLPPGVIQLMRTQPAEGGKDTAGNRDADVCVYTHVQLAPGGQRYISYQEVKGVKIPKTEGSWPKKLCPYIALRWSRIPGESYGRGRGEEYLGDLASLESLSKSLIEAAAAAAKINFLVNPMGMTNLQDLESAGNLAYVSGRGEDVTTPQVNKTGDIGMAQSIYNDIVRRLSVAFLRMAGLQRDGERVTAAEIEALRNELYQALGGVMSNLDTELLLSVVELTRHQMEADNVLPKLPKVGGRDAWSLTIVTGVDALGRNSELDRLRALRTEVQALLGPELTAKYLNVDVILKKLTVALGFGRDGMIRDGDEVRAEQAQQQNAQQMGALAGPGINALAKLATAPQPGQPQRGTENPAQ